MLWIAMAGCGPTEVSEPCTCPSAGQAARACNGGRCGACLCLPSLPATPRAEPARVFFVDPDVSKSGGDGSPADPWRELVWAPIDAALATGDVTVFFSARLASSDANQTSKGEIQILGPSRLILDGRSQANLDDAAPRWVAYSGAARAQWRGVTTTEQHLKKSRVTVTGFELRDSVSQGVFWEAGDEVVLEDLVISNNGRSPAILLEYADRSGLPSDHFTVRNNHLFNITGECIYIGGREGTEGPSHSHVLIENNLVHDCGFRDRNGDDWDGINLKDRLTSAVVRHNVIYRTHWGIQMTSVNAVVEENLIFDTDAAGIMVGGGGWGVPLDSDTRISDNVILRAGGDPNSGSSSGIYVDADQEGAKGAVFTHNTIASTRSGPAMMLAGNGGLSIDLGSNWLTHSSKGLDGWGDVQVSIEDTAFFANTHNATRAPASVDAVGAVPQIDPRYVDLLNPAGVDRIYFTADDGWLAQTAALRGARLAK